MLPQAHAHAHTGDEFRRVKMYSAKGRKEAVVCEGLRGECCVCGMGCKEVEDIKSDTRVAGNVPTI